MSNSFSFPTDATGIVGEGVAIPNIGISLKRGIVNTTDNVGNQIATLVAATAGTPDQGVSVNLDKTYYGGAKAVSSRIAIPSTISHTITFWQNPDTTVTSAPDDLVTAAATQYYSMIWPAYQYQFAWLILYTNTVGDATTPVQIWYTYEDYEGMGPSAVYWDSMNLTAPVQDTTHVYYGGDLGTQRNRYIWRWHEGMLNNFGNSGGNMRVRGFYVIYKEGAGAGTLRGTLGFRYEVGH